MTGLFSCCQPSDRGVAAASSAPLDRHAENRWTTKEKVGLGLVIFALAMLAIATCLSQGVFDKMMHISSANIGAGVIGISSLFFLIPGLVLLCKPCGVAR